MINAYKNFFKNYAEFTGRSTRPDFWWVWLGNLILSIPFYMVYGAAMANPDSEAAVMTLGLFVFIYLIFGLAVLLPGLALTVRRLRDAGFHWALIFVIFIPMVGPLALLALLAMPTKQVEVVTINETEEVVEVSPFEESDKN